MELFPKIEPYENGWLEVDINHKLYWEKCGNSTATPILVIHGGPRCGRKYITKKIF